MRVGSPSVLGPGVSSWLSSLGNKGRVYAPLEAGHDQGNSVVPHEVEEVSAADGSTRSLGV